jgi:hypothetical protein
VIEEIEHCWSCLIFVIEHIMLPIVVIEEFGCSSWPFVVIEEFGESLL